MPTGSTWSFTVRRCANYTGSRAVRCGCFRCWSRAAGPFLSCCPSCWQRSTSRTASGRLVMNSSGAATKCWSSPPRDMRAFSSGLLRSRSINEGQRHGLHAVTQVGGDDRGVAADFLRGAPSDDLAELEDHHAVADAEDQAHVVLDEKQGLALVGPAANGDGA